MNVSDYCALVAWERQQTIVSNGHTNMTAGLSMARI